MKFGLSELIEKLWDYKIVRFVIVGSFNSAVDIILTVLILYKLLELPVLLANTISVTFVVTMSYFLNHQIVFRYRQGYTLKNYLRFFAVTGFSAIVIQYLVIYVVTEKLWKVASTSTFTVAGHDFFIKTIVLIVAKILAILLGMIWNFLLYKYVVFRHKVPDEAEELIVV